MRVMFGKGRQREFLKSVLINANSPSLRELSRRLGVSYSTLKNYYVEARFLPENLFNDLCSISGISKKKLNVKLGGDNWGQVKGGKKSKRVVLG